jgi:hypothetical protein
LARLFEVTGDDNSHAEKEKEKEKKQKRLNSLSPYEGYFKCSKTRNPQSELTTNEIPLALTVKVINSNISIIALISIFFIDKIQFPK